MVERNVERYLAFADRRLPGRVTDLVLVGSAALGDFRPDRSDIDFVAVVDRRLDHDELRALSRVHRASGIRTTAEALRAGNVTLPGTMNGVFVAEEDLTRPVTSIVPVASHVAQHFSAGSGFDVNPVMWTVLQLHGVTVRGRDRSELRVDPEPEVLAQWNRDNLAGYWQTWAERLAARPGAFPARLIPASHRVQWGVLGPPRLHCTIRTGDIVSKSDAGRYALDTFDERWHPLVTEALAHRRGEKPTSSWSSAQERDRAVAGFVLDVVADAAAA